MPFSAKARVFILFLLIFSLLIFAAFKRKDNHVSPETMIRKYLIEQTDSLYHSVKNLQTISESSSVNLQAQLKSAFYQCRKDYKKIEFLVDYFDNETAENLNGGNIPHGEPDPKSVKIIPPRGLQVIEELIFNDSVDIHKNEISKLSKLLMDDILSFKKNSIPPVLTSSLIFDACRNEIIRICFLGITGFDSPIAKNSLKESAIALNSIQQTIAKYQSLIKQDAALTNSLKDAFSSAQSYLHTHDDFNSFNRYYFIKYFGNTLYSQILDVQNLSGISLTENNDTNTSPVNREVNNLFDENLLNPSYYSSQANEILNENTKQLGSFLFFDPVLSINNKRACASCHQPNKAFTDGLTKSTALDFNGTVKRNAPTLLNAIFQGGYFYDIRAEFPEEQIADVVENELEFHNSFENIVQTLKQSNEYLALFKKTFPEEGENAINTFTVKKSISDYLRSLVAMQSDFDKSMQSGSADIAQNIQNGFNLFMGKAQCGTCHFAPTFYGTVPPFYTESETEVIGVPITNDTVYTLIDTDEGRYDIQKVSIYKHAFKTQTIRNIELTAPYMHNGVFKTLEEVMDFYNRGGAAGLGIKLENQTLATDKLNLTKSEISDMIAFMNSLTDTSGTSSSPLTLPKFENSQELNARKPGGEY